MPGDWPDILNRLHAHTAPGASAEGVARFEREAGVTLPPDLRDLLLTADGAEVDPRFMRFMRLLSLEDMRGYVRAFLGSEPGSRLGYVALTNTNDSNPFCLSTRGPLEGFVVRVHHDDDTEVAFRSLRGFFRALEALAARGGEGTRANIDHIEMDFRSDNRSDRTEDDDRRAAELLRAADGEFDPADDERMWLVVLAMQLLSDRQGGVVAPYLEDHYHVRLAARKTLAEMRTPEAERALSSDRRAMAEFIKRAAAALRAAGLRVSRTDSRGEITLDPGNVHLNMDAAFHRRGEAGFIDEFVAGAARAVDRKGG